MLRTRPGARGIAPAPGRSLGPTYWRALLALYPPYKNLRAIDLDCAVGVRYRLPKISRPPLPAWPSPARSAPAPSCPPCPPSCPPNYIEDRGTTEPAPALRFSRFSVPVPRVPRIFEGLTGRRMSFSALVPRSPVRPAAIYRAKCFPRATLPARPQRLTGALRNQARRKMTTFAGSPACRRSSVSAYHWSMTRRRSRYSARL